MGANIVIRDRGRGLSDTDRLMINQAFQDALKMANLVATDINKIWNQPGRIRKRRTRRRNAWSSPSNKHFVKWFGSSTRIALMRRLRRRILRIRRWLSKARIVVVAHDAQDLGCRLGNNRAALARLPRRPVKIHLCPRWFEYSAKVRAGIIIHELVHQLGFSHPKGTTNAEEAIQLARDSSRKARRSPENYEHLFKLYLAFVKGIDAGLYVQTNDKIYFFKGDEYLRINPASATMDADYPKPIAGPWKGLPPNFIIGGIDAAVWRQSNNKIYFFKGSQYVRITPGSFAMDAGYPKPIAGNWKGLPPNFADGIDAGLYVQTNDKIYFFKGSQYVQINPASATMDADYPKPIAGPWKGLPPTFTGLFIIGGIDAAVWRQSNNKIYFFKGSQYVRITPGSFAMDAGYPKPIAGNWKGLPPKG